MPCQVIACGRSLAMQALTWHVYLPSAADAWLAPGRSTIASQVAAIVNGWLVRTRWDDGR
ncbi:MAG: hypothetical protein ACK54K_02045 [Gemmatimonadaceae bacterium]